ncbi:MAG TPA: type II toxin-antitoxin system RelE/ParE family toxin [Dehalococcoidia bacterium]|nr:type II toxin-antitoxin system RelE/ParE family toxin [Dehalococcoidia bacterium]
MPARDRERLTAAIAALADEPRPRQARKLAASEMWRLRVGEYRVLYTISDARQEIMVQRIERRTTTTHD